MLLIGMGTSLEAGDFEDSRKFCDAGDVYACGALGHMYQKGKGVRQSYSKGKELYGKACDVGDAIGCENYARLNKK